MQAILSSAYKLPFESRHSNILAPSVIRIISVFTKKVYRYRHGNERLLLTLL